MGRSCVKDLRVLVLAAAYPTIEGERQLYYVHARNLYYVANNIKVTVLNFAAKFSYEIEGIRVISSDNFKKEMAADFDALILHAANIRNHYLFLLRYGELFSKKVFIFHGHEVLHINKYYPPPYNFVRKQSCLRKLFQDIYDDFKLAVWRRYIIKNINSIRLVFVSGWFYRQFLCETKIQPGEIQESVDIIPNCIGSFFEENFSVREREDYDFLTIRNNMDSSTYCIDVVIKLATEYPEYKFCLIGKGRVFDYYAKPANLIWIDRELSHEEMRSFINNSRIALMPTREDTQGLMACELASCGMPLITSDIEVCKEVFEGCSHVAFIKNENPDLRAAVSLIEDNVRRKPWKRYYAKNTIAKEIRCLKLHIIK